MPTYYTTVATPMGGNFSSWYANSTGYLLSAHTYHTFNIDIGPEQSANPAPVQVEYRYYKDGQYHTNSVVFPDGSGSISGETGDTVATTGSFEFRVKALGPYGTALNFVSYDTPFLQEPYNPNDNPIGGTTPSQPIGGADGSGRPSPDGGGGGAGYGASLSSPIAFDLNGDGLHYTATNTGHVYFDIDNDHFAERVEWLDTHDGFLVRDLNGNGQIDNVGEMFGDNGGTSAYTKLAALDSNSSGTLTSADTAWSTLRVWVDGNTNGRVDSGELQTLSSLGITSINTTHTSDTVSGGHAVAGTSTYMQGGVTHNAADVLLDTHQLDSWYVGDGTDASIRIDPATLFLPMSRGYGTLESLPYAMTQDATLKTMMENFVAINPSTSNMKDAYDQIDAFIHQWAGATGIDPASRGAFNAQSLTVLEAVNGIPYYNTAQNSPNVPAGPNETYKQELGAAYSLFKAEIAERMLVQGPLQTIFTNAEYSFSTDSMTLNDSLDHILANAQLIAPATGDSQRQFWSQIDNIIERHISEFGGITTSQAASAVDLAAGFAVDRISVMGTTGNDILGGQSTGPYESYAGTADTIFGGAGNDSMYGSGGDDLYLFDNSSGSDRIVDRNTYPTSQYDAVKLSVDPSQVTLSIANTYDLQISAASISETITVANHTFSDQSIEELQFSDGTIWNLATINAVAAGGTAPTTATGTSGNDSVTLTGSQIAMKGLGGSDTFIMATGKAFISIADFNAAAGDLIDIRSIEGTSTTITPFSIHDVVGHAMLTIGTTTIALSGVTASQLTAANFISNYIAGSTAASGSTITGSGLAETINGSNGSDLIYANGGTDSVVAGMGNDTIYGWTENDSIFGGIGADVLVGDQNNDLLFGEAGNDILSGGDDNDNLYGGDGNDTISGEAGNDYVFGDNGFDSLDGGSGMDTLSYINSTASVNVNLSLATIQLGAYAHGDIITGFENLDGSNYQDTLSGDSVANYLQGYDGNDTLSGMAGSDTLDGGNGNDTLNGGGSDDPILAGLANNDLIYGGVGNDGLIGDSPGDAGVTGNDTLYGEAGNDTIYAGPGNDVAYGGADNDYIDDIGGNDTIDGGDGNDSIYAGAGTDSILGGAGIDFIDGNVGNDTIYGGDGDDGVLSGNQDNDIIYGGAGNDGLIGDSASDSTVGGNDTLYGGDGNDTIYPGPGADLAYGGIGADTIADTFTGGADTVYGEDGNDYISLTGTGDLIYGDSSVEGTGDGADTILGNGGSDLIYGGGGNDSILGGTGNDSIIGGTGADTLNGGDDADILVGNAGADNIDGGNGFDVVSYQLSSAAVSIDLATNTNTGGDAASDLLYNIERIFGSIYNDSMTGSTTNDWFQAYDGNDSLFGGSGADTIEGMDGADTLSGDDGNDSLIGGAGDDIINGMYGDDWIDGGAGNDGIIGFYGNDTFAFSSGSGVDQIFYFEGAGVAGGDVIQIQNHINGGSIVTAADVLSHITYSGGNAIIDLGSGNTITLTSVTSMIASDFAVV